MKNPFIAVIFIMCCFLSNAQGTWTQKANLGGTGRQGAASFSIGSKGYVGTGSDGYGVFIDFWEYDPTTNIWTQKANFGGTARWKAVGFSIGSKGYIGTGEAGFGLGALRNDFWEYDPSSNIWTQKASFGGTARSEATGFSIGTKGYIGTGWDNTANSKNDFWEYNQSADTWTQKTPFGGTARNRAVGFSIGTKGYIGTGAGSGLQNDFWEYNPSANTWTQKANFGGGLRQTAVGFSSGTKGYIGTGYNSTPNLTNDFWEYNPSSNTWTQKTNVGGAFRGLATGFGIGTKGYIGTGSSVSGSGTEYDFWEYTPCPPSGTACNDGNGCTTADVEDGNCNCTGTPQAPVKHWDFRFGGTDSEILYSLQQTSDGGYILGGESASGISGDKTQASQGGTDYWVVKIDASGVKQWDKRFGGSSTDVLQSLQQTTDGGYILGGYSFSDISGDKTQASRGSSDYWVVKINASGVKQWDARFGGSDIERLYTLQQTTDGGYILGGHSYSGASGDKSQGSQGTYDYWVVKINTSGVKQWDARFGGSGADYLYSVKQTTDGGYILGGISDSNISGDKTQNSQGGNDLWIVKIDFSGNKQWDKRFGGSSDETIGSLQQTSDGGYILGGDSQSGISGDKTQASWGSWDYWVVKITGTGVKQWDKRFGGTLVEELNSIQQTSDGGYILGGSSDSGISGDKTQPWWGNADYWLVKIDASGLKQWDVRFGGLQFDGLNSLQQTSDEGYIMGGRTQSTGVGGDKTQANWGTGTSEDYWIVKAACTCPLAGTPCNDGTACTTGETEDGNCHCAGGTPVTCDDGLFCNGTETCNPVSGCVAGTDPANDGTACTLDFCNESTDQVTHTSITCDDGLFCNGTETCNPATGCVAGNPGTNDGISCTVDACDEANDVISHTPNNAVCNDALFCTGTETCTPPTGCVTSPAPIDDAIDCTVDACNEANDVITHTPDNAVCDDCNSGTTDICSPVSGCPYISPTIPNKLWDVRFGGSSADQMYAIQQTSDGGYMLGGYSNSGLSGDKTQASQGSYDFWVVKTDNSGTKQWDSRFGGSNAEYLQSVKQTTDGGYILGGNSTSGISGDKTQASQGSNDFWVVKIDGSGNKQWDKRFGGSNSELLYFLQQTTDGGYILGGSSDSGISGDKTQASRGSTDYWVVKIDGSGNKQWDARFGGSNIEQLNSLQQTTDGGYILGGSSDSGISGDKTQASRGNTDYWIIKIDGNGVKQWDKRFGGSGVDRLNSLQQTSDGGYLLGGYSSSGISGDKTQASRGNTDYWIVKIDGNGVRQWDKRFGGSAVEQLYSLQQTSDGGYLLGGYSSSGISGDKTQTLQGSSDFWMVKIFDCGAKQWDARFGGSTWDELRFLKQTNDGGYVLGGFSDSGISGDKTQASRGGYDFWMVKVEPDSPNQWTGATGTTVWSNPANWSNGVVPTVAMNVRVPAVASNVYPVLTGASDIQINNLTIDAGASFTLNFSQTAGVPQAALIVNGNITNNGNADLGKGFITMKGSSIAGNVLIDFLKIDNSTGVSLASGASLGVRKELDLTSGNFNVSAGTHTLESDASSTGLINDWGSNTGTITGNINIERYVPSSAFSNFHYVGSACGGSTVNIWSDDFANTANSADDTPITPTFDCSPNALDPGSAYGSVFTYDESLVTDCYLSGWRVNTTSHATQRGYGFASIVTGGTVLDETCTYAKTNVDLSSLSITAANTISYSKGYHLVSNPFFAPIDWSAMATINNGLNNHMDATAYIYNPNSGTYGPYNLITGGYITTSMGFFVRHVPSYAGATYNVRFDASTRTTLNNDAFLRQSQPYEYGLNVMADNGSHSDQTLIAFDENFTDGYDNGYDAAKMQSSFGVPTLYTLDSSDQRMSIQAVGINMELKSVPLGLNVRGASGNYTLTFTGIQDFPATEIIWLEDLQLDSIQYLQQTDTYSFYAAEADNPDRFIIHFLNEKVSISGNITTENGSGINGVTVAASGTSDATDITDLSGSYLLDFSQQDSITVTPSKSNDVNTNNGISTLDIILMRRHILNIALFNSPYKIIAADVDFSNSVSTLDILLTRTVILQINPTFPNGKLWAFTPNDYVFANPQDPFPFPSSRSYSELNSDWTAQDFIGMKLGDVNGDWDPNIAKTQVAGETGFVMDEFTVITGQEISVSVKAKDFKNITGYQFTLSWNSEVLEFLDVTNRTLEGFYGMMKTREGFLTASWNDGLTRDITLNDNEVVFELRFKVRGEKGSFSSIQIGSEMTRSEAYNAHFDLLEVVPTNGMVKVADVSSILNPPSSILHLQVQPNPFTNTAQIIFDLAHDETVTVSIYDIFGKRVKLVKGNFKAGRNQLEWAGDDDSGNLLSHGLYHVRMIAQEGTSAVKVELMR